MKNLILFLILAIAISFSSCTRDDLQDGGNSPALAASSDILIQGEDATVILDNIETVRTNLEVIAQSLTRMSQEEDFAELVAAPMRSGVKVGNFSHPLGALISDDGTNEEIDASYLDAMEGSLEDLEVESPPAPAIGSIAARFQINGEWVYPKITVSIIGERKVTPAEDQDDIDIRPEFIAISQSYSPGMLPAWKITSAGVEPMLVNPGDIYERNVWYVGIADVGGYSQGSGLTFKLLAQGEECSCYVAATNGCVEASSNGSSILKCGSTDTNCDCPNGCDGAGMY